MAVSLLMNDEAYALVSWRIAELIAVDQSNGALLVAVCNVKLL
jgi:hypothetical protein